MICGAAAQMDVKLLTIAIGNHHALSLASRTEMRWSLYDILVIKFCLDEAVCLARANKIVKCFARGNFGELPYRTLTSHTGKLPIGRSRCYTFGLSDAFAFNSIFNGFCNTIRFYFCHLLYIFVN